MILALIAITGLHWAALQTIAWTTMLADNLQIHSFTQSVTQTFDGKHPCPLCKAIAAGKKTERKNEFVSQLQKFEFLPINENTVLIAPSQFGLLSPVNVFAESYSQEPLLPPPRRSFA